MVVPPVVVSAVMPDRAPYPAAVLIEMAMRPSRDKGAVPAKSLILRVSSRSLPVNPVLEVFCAEWRFGEYYAARALIPSATTRSIFPLDAKPLFQHR